MDVHSQVAGEGWLRLDGDWGGVMYLACPAALVRCSEEGLHALHEDLERLCGDEPDGREFSDDASPPTAGELNLRRMVLCGRTWINPVFVKSGVSNRILDVLDARRDRLGTAEEWGLLKAQVDAAFVNNPGGLSSDDGPHGGHRD